MTAREFVTCNGDSSEARVLTNWSDARVVYVAEVMHDMKAVDVDVEDVECSEQERNRTLICDLIFPLFCCRGPHRKLPPQSPEDALRNAAAKGREGLRLGETVLLNGVEVTL